MGNGKLRVGGHINKTTAELNRSIVAHTTYDGCSNSAPAKKSHLKFRKISEQLNVNYP